MTHQYPVCVYCQGQVVEKAIEWDYRRGGKHLIFQNVPAGVCGQCGEKFFRPEVSRRMDQYFHMDEPPREHAQIPVIHFKSA
jgi:YgiT-type zinc finger domain-containing protein